MEPRRMGKNRLEQSFLLSTVVLLTGAGFLGSLPWTLQLQNWIYISLTVLFSTISGLAALVCLHIASLHPSNSHTLSSVMLQYIVYFLLPLLTRSRIRKLQNTFKHCQQTQEKVLKDILSHNSATLYGKEYGFADIKNIEQFKKQHPVTKYSHFEHYVKKVLEGEKNVLFQDETAHIAVTSGTTGKNKLFPINARSKDFNLVCLALGTDSKPDLRRILGLRGGTPKISKSPSGITIAPLAVYSSPPSPFFVTPKEAYDIKDEKTILYVHAVFGLAEKDIGYIDGMMSPFVYSFFKCIENNWKQLCEDIQQGKISDTVEMDHELRKKLNDHLRPDPIRAMELHKEFSVGFAGITKRVWHNINSINMLATGGFASSTKLLSEHYTKGIPVLSLHHAGTEGYVGMFTGDDPAEFTYTALPFVNFFEFIREEECQEENPETLLMHQLELDNNYEVVITCWSAGLYRYRMGDVIKVIGYHFECPTYQFQYRLGQLLNVFWEKLPESVFYSAIEKTMQEFPNITLVDYTATESVNMDKIEESSDNTLKHYVLFVELTKTDNQYNMSLQEKQKFDSNLCAEYEIYKNLRSGGSIGPIEVKQVKPGTFQRLKYKMITESQNPQFKMPRVMRNQENLQFLLEESKL